MSRRPTSVEPVKVILRTVGIGGHFAADLLRVAGHDVEHAGGNAGAFRQNRQRERRVRRLTSRA